MDFKRIAQYSRNMADYNLITDLLPTIAQLFFSEQIDSSVDLGIIQSAILLSMGLQRKNVDAVSSELKLQKSQVLAHFNKAIRKFSNYFDQLCTSAIEEAMSDEHKNVEQVTASLKPTATSLEDEIKSGEQEIRERQKRDKESLFSELGISDVVNGNSNGQLSQFAIKATDEEWAGTLRGLKLSNAKSIGIVSVKAPKRPADSKKSTNEAMDSSEPTKSKKPKTEFKKVVKKKKSRNY